MGIDLLMAVQRVVRLSAVTMLAVCLAGLAPVRAQSLADVAKREEDRRKSAPKTGKVYTNKDLSPAPSVSSPPAADAKPKEAKDGADAKDGKDAKDPALKDADASGDKAPKGRAYWLGRMKAAQDKLARDTNFADAMQTRINALTTDAANRDDPLQRAAAERNRQTALAELARLKKDIADDQKAIDAVQEEARRAAVPPGWLR
jgi:hypothetical protein